MSNNPYTGMRLVPRQRPEIHLCPAMWQFQRLLICPPLASSSEKKMVPPPDLPKASLSSNIVKQVAQLIEQEDVNAPLSDREILSRMSTSQRERLLTSQTIARARYQLGLPPSAQRKS